MEEFDKTTKCRVLVVEDDFAQRNLFTEVLDADHVSVIGVLSAAEALETLQTAGHVDLLVTDIRLIGETNGFELAAQARHIQQNLKVMFVTGHPHEVVYEQRSADRHAEIMFKPFKLSDFAQRVGSLLEDLPCHTTWLALSRAKG